MGAVCEARRVVFGRVRRFFAELVDHLDPDQVPEAAAMREAVRAAWRVERVE